jgi:hypothetical protein
MYEDDDKVIRESLKCNKQKKEMDVVILESWTSMKRKRELDSFYDEMLIQKEVTIEQRRLGIHGEHNKTKCLLLQNGGLILQILLAFISLDAMIILRATSKRTSELILKILDETPIHSLLIESFVKCVPWRLGQLLVNKIKSLRFMASHNIPRCKLDSVLTPLLFFPVDRIYLSVSGYSELEQFLAFYSLQRMKRQVIHIYYTYNPPTQTNEYPRIQEKVSSFHRVTLRSDPYGEQFGKIRNFIL